jgi:TonB family protein
VNFITDQKQIKEFGVSENGVIEIKLFSSERPIPENIDTLIVMINGVKLNANTNQSPPLLVFDENIVQDQNPNNLDTRQMKWIDFHLADSVTFKYGEKAISGLILAELIPPPPGLLIDYESAPEFPGGENALRAFIKNNMVYPIEAIKDSLQGKVYVNFVISKAGKVENVQIARGVHPVLDEEAIRVVSSMPDWKPAVRYFRGKLGEQKVVVTYTIPVNFKLPDVYHNP